MNDAVATRLLILTASASAAPVTVRGFFAACGAPGDIPPPPRRLKPRWASADRREDSGKRCVSARELIRIAFRPLVPSCLSLPEGGGAARLDRPHRLGSVTDASLLLDLRVCEARSSILERCYVDKNSYRYTSIFETPFHH